MPQRVLYVGNSGTTRAQAHTKFLETHFAQVESADREAFDLTSASKADVVVLDWSQNDAQTIGRAEFSRPERIPKSPLGERAGWEKPTVLLGSAGHLLAAPWQVHGGSGCTCLKPFAYGLRAHVIFTQPIPIERSRMIRRDAPSSWKGFVESTNVSVLPLVQDFVGQHNSGWCTYVEGPLESPDVEILCGGINDKTPTAAAIWRQGNLLHFGFDLSPAEMSDDGRALLVNSIAYIATFTEDRPIVRSPSPFAGPAPEPRGRIDRILKREDLDTVMYLKGSVASSMLSAADPGKPAAYQIWYDGVRDFVHADENAKLCVDEEARVFGIPPNKPGFFDGMIAALQGPVKRAELARRLLVRYAPPEGPGLTAPAAIWADWWKEHKAFLFFSDVGGYRWYLDPLAKRRGIPTAKLRGPARADRQFGL
ncbi:hypothetical protein SAMN05444166_8285 [Singulisphaera sp. GP187]|nr:hypothetical protein SAMN05444166_8285 [Singulisphaera sp. GP187]